MQLQFHFGRPTLLIACKWPPANSQMDMYNEYTCEVCQEITDARVKMHPFC